jgi:hypothetical protein
MMQGRFGLQVVASAITAALVAGGTLALGQPGSRTAATASTLKACYVKKGSKANELRLMHRGKCGKGRKRVTWSVNASAVGTAPATTSATATTGEMTPASTPAPTSGNGATNVTVVRSDFTVEPYGGINGGSAMCPAGAATGGGVGSDTGDGLVVEQSGPVDQDLSFSTLVTGKVPTGWYGKWLNNDGVQHSGYVYAICTVP